MKQAFRGISGSHVDEHELWRHLVAVGMLADEAAWGRVTFSDVFTVGLLHDLGRLAMASEDPKRYGQAVRMARATGDTIAAEQRVFGLDHTEWGASIGRQWGLPDDMVEGIADHHVGEASGLAWVLAKARQQAAAMGIGDGVLGPDGGPEAAAEARDPLLRRVDAFVSSIRRAA